jgi:hypothetical protein
MAILEQGVTGQIGVAVNKVTFSNQSEITVVHNLNKTLMIQVLNSGGEYITSGVDIDVISSNEFRVSSTSAFSGAVIYF